MDQNTAPGAPMPMKQNTVMGILSYLGILVIIPYIVAKDDSFVKFHIKQGLVLFVAEIIVWILSAYVWQLWMIWQLVNLAILILAIVGIVNVVQGKEKELPLVGSLADQFSI